jgi:hypothetical protein
MWAVDFNCPIVAGATPTAADTFFPLKGEYKATKFAGAIGEVLATQPNRPVVLHLMSGAGFLFSSNLFKFAAAAEALPELGPPVLSRWKPLEESMHEFARSTALLAKNLRGIILDSSPSPFSGDVAARALVASSLREQVGGVQRRHPLLVAGASAALGAYLGHGWTARKLEAAWEAWETWVPRVPRLFIYSTADALVPAPFVERFAREEAGRGCRVESLVFGDSEHVEHLRVHPAEYRDAVDKFVGGLSLGGPPPDL